MNREEFKKNINEALDNVETIEELNKVLDSMHPSDAHTVINDMLKNNLKIRKIINTARNADDKSQYQLYQHIKMSAKKSYEHDMTPARLIDVDMVATRVYTILLGMISEMNKILIKQGEAINTIERKIGLDVTDFTGGDNNDTAGHGDVQRIEEDS